MFSHFHLSNFLCALNAQILVEEIVTNTNMKQVSDIIHAKLLGFVGEYLAIGVHATSSAMLARKSKTPLTCPRLSSLYTRRISTRFW